MLPNFETASVGPQCTFSAYKPTGVYTIFKYDRQLWHILKRATESRDAILRQCAIEALNVARELEATNMQCPIYRQFVELELSIYFATHGTKGE